MQRDPKHMKLVLRPLLSRARETHAFKWWHGHLFDGKVATIDRRSLTNFFTSFFDELAYHRIREVPILIGFEMTSDKIPTLPFPVITKQVLMLSSVLAT